MVIVLNNGVYNARFVVTIDIPTTKSRSGLATIRAFYETINLLFSFKFTWSYTWSWFHMSRTPVLIATSSSTYRNGTNLSSLSFK